MIRNAFNNIKIRPYLALLVLYVLVYFWLWAGVLAFGDSRAFLIMAVYGVSLLAAFLLMGILYRRFLWVEPYLGALSFSATVATPLLWLLVALTALGIGYHFYAIDFFPLKEAMFSFHPMVIAGARQSLDMHDQVTLKYGSSLLVRGILPTLLLLAFLRKDRWLQAVILLLGGLYAIALMQKGLILFLISPALIYCLFRYQWVGSLALVAYTALLFGFLTVVVNPDLRPNFWPRSNEDATMVATPGPDDLRDQPLTPRMHFERQSLNLEQLPTSGLPQAIIADGPPMFVLDSKAKVITYAILDRLIIVPGQVVAQWAALIPEKQPYTRGCSYRFLASFLDCEFINLPQEIYKLLYPTSPLDGTANVASFMEDYANFAWIGLVMSAFFLGFILLMSGYVFADNSLAAVALSGVHILGLSSVALPFALYSGGWAVSILLYLLFRKHLPQD